jgi:hypothetical protein
MSDPREELERRLKRRLAKLVGAKNTPEGRRLLADAARSELEAFVRDVEKRAASRRA